ncbi:hypothetical protein [Mesorhizobium sp. M7A.F.Ca.ET.027.03.2.1]|uniref:hypothetical protein n=1 Tax=Mesorhizobium sp. M7A.F.Ca.ET.027.03.2.1 TaxID=2496656 RepID=UPI001AEC9310|nr:hypothetical protein [Mesorhizobium sp. M7A.F.Ca.ET.027.03.2.1]
MQLERLDDATLTTEQIASEVARTEAIVKVADKIVDNARLNLQACELVAKHGDRFMKHLPMIGAPDAPALDFKKKVEGAQ